MIEQVGQLNDRARLSDTDQSRECKRRVAGPRADAWGSERQRVFAYSHSVPADDTTTDDVGAKLRASAGEVVGLTFYGTLLAMQRDSELKGKYGHGGRGEEIFTAQLHGMLSERMGQRENNSLTEAIVRAYEKQAAKMSKPPAKCEALA